MLQEYMTEEHKNYEASIKLEKLKLMDKQKEVN